MSFLFQVNHQQPLVYRAQAMSLNRLITACFCSWGLKSGYVEVPVRDAVGRGFDLVFGEKYFGSRADVGEHTVFVSSSDEDSKRLEFLVFFDRNLHGNGTQRCPYLVFKIAEGRHVENLTRSDFAAVVVAIDECVYLLFLELCGYTYIHPPGCCMSFPQVKWLPISLRARRQTNLSSLIIILIFSCLLHISLHVLLYLRSRPMSNQT